MVQVVTLSFFFFLSFFSVFHFPLKIVYKINIPYIYISVHNPLAKNVRVTDVAKCRILEDLKTKPHILHKTPSGNWARALQTRTPIFLRQSEGRGTGNVRKTDLYLFHSDRATKFVSENLSICRALRMSELQIRGCRSVYTLATGLGGSSFGTRNLLAPHHFVVRSMFCLSPAF